MTPGMIRRLLVRHRILAIVIRALIHDPEKRETSWFQWGRACGRPLREFLVEADPDSDPALYLQALQAVEALREEQMWVRQVQAGGAIPFRGRWH